MTPAIARDGGRIGIYLSWPAIQTKLMQAVVVMGLFPLMFGGLWISRRLILWLCAAIPGRADGLELAFAAFIALIIEVPVIAAVVIAVLKIWRRARGSAASRRV